VESLGVKLRTAREGKDLDFDQASKDTKIAIRYLQALENEDFSDFPGETYITGFLKNYGAYLDLDIQEILSLYRAFKIQEQPVPVEQLLKKSSLLPKILLIILLIIIALGAIGAGVWFFLNRPKTVRPAEPASRAPAEYSMSGDSFEHRFFIGDSILVPAGLEQYRLELQNLGEMVTIRTPGGTVILDLSLDANINLDNNGISELRIAAVDYAKNNADMGVVLRFELSNDIYIDSTPMNTLTETSATVSFPASTTVFSSSTPFPFTLQSFFQGYCMFRWEILLERDRREKNEQYFQRSDELNIQAQNGIRIWASNAQAAKFQVIGGGRTVPVEIGSPGEVVVADIRWVRDEDSRYRLVVARLETGRT
jgi:cytoskeletal protein RodZ